MIKVKDLKIENATNNEYPLKNYVKDVVKRVHTYLSAFNGIIWGYKNSGLLQVYDAGFIDLDKQNLTIGINGFVEGAEFLKHVKDKDYNDIDIKANNEAYKKYSQDILTTIKELNAQAKTTHCKFNTEFVPAESLGPKNYKWDKEDGYFVPENRNSYNSYFYLVEDETCSPLEKFSLMGKDFTGCLDGGSALHMNLDEHLSKTQYSNLLKLAVKNGCNYFTFNIPNTICNECGYISKHHLDHCPKCGSKNIDYITRIIGYLKRVSSFSEPRQIEASKRYYAKANTVKEEPSI